MATLAARQPEEVSIFIQCTHALDKSMGSKEGGQWKTRMQLV